MSLLKALPFALFLKDRHLYYTWAVTVTIHICGLFSSWTKFNMEEKVGNLKPLNYKIAQSFQFTYNPHVSRSLCVFFWLLRLPTPTTCPSWPSVLGEGASIHDSAADSWWSEVIILGHGLKRSHKNGAHSNHLLLRSVWAGAWAGET